LDPTQLAELPRGINVDDASSETGAATYFVSVTREAEAGLHQIDLPIALFGRVIRCPLTIKAVWLPADREFKGSGEIVSVDGRFLYATMTRQGFDPEPDGAADFLLIRTDKDLVPGAPPKKSFYIMRDKVWRGLYRRVSGPGLEGASGAKREPTKPSPTSPDDDRLPVTGITIQEALRFARELAGQSAKLPDFDEWWLAAGMYSPNRGDRAGPFRIAANGSEPDVALVKPAPVGTSKDDVANSGCRDMAGNGYEWTMTPDKQESVVEPIPDDQGFLIVGRAWDDSPQDGPLTFDFQQARRKDCPSMRRSSDSLGFRVVIHPF
jgi:formylglycine-generating enzyme required for sulfatase activity